MNRVTLKYLGAYAIHSGVILVLGLIWIANSIFLGMLIDPTGRPEGCAVGVLNHVALDWSYFVAIGFLGTFGLIAAFGFLSSWVTNGRRSIYAVLIFVTPLFGLVSQNVVWTSNSMRYYVDVFGSFVIATIIIAGVFLPAFYFHRRLTNRCTGRPGAAVTLRAMVLFVPRTKCASYWRQ